jgi:C1A family cysteine protease
MDPIRCFGRGIVIGVAAILVSVPPAAFGAGAGSGTTFPATYDLRTLNRVGAVQDEYQFGIPWACAAVASLESSLLTQGKGSYSLSIWDLAWFTYNNFSSTLVAFDNSESGQQQQNFSQGGNIFQPEAILERGTGAVSAVACPTPTAYPYPVADIPSTSDPVVARCQQTLYLGANPAISDIKTAVTNDGATAVRLWVETASLPNLAATSGYYYTGQDLGHMVTIVGWDDTFPAARCQPSQPSQDGAWIAANCWGTGWADGGYFYLSYESALFDGTVFLGATVNYDQIYQYDPLGRIGTYGFGGDTASFANVFTAQAAQSIQAAAFYVNAPGSTCQVSVRTGVTGDPSTGTLAAGPVPGTFTYAGYQTVQLPAPVNVAAGETFAVIVALTTPGLATPIPIHYPQSGYSSAATNSAGRSFVSSSGTAWTDMTTLQANTSVCLKALAGPPAPTVSSLVPAAGIVGAQVTLTGSGFTGATAVSFDGISAPGFTVVNDTEIIVDVPSGATSGTISVTTPYGTNSSLNAFTVDCLAACSPGHGVPGIPLTLTGAGLTGTTSLTLNGAPCAILTNSDSQITTTVPSGATTGTFTAVCPKGTLTTPAAFQVLSYDLNGDGVVDVRDLATLATLYGSTSVIADLGGDGTVDGHDITLWLQAF